MINRTSLLAAGMQRAIVLAPVLALSAVFIWNDAAAQIDADRLRHAVRGDSVFVYHIQQVPVGQGFNIYRRDEGVDEFVRLNEFPVQGVVYPDELPSALGELYEQVQSALEAQNPVQTFFALRSNSILGRLYTFVHPEVAAALGRLYIDTTAAPGEKVSYRIEFVDDLGRPTGTVLEEDVTLEEMIPEPPSDIQLSNDGYAMTINWHYPSSGRVDDKVIRFEILESGPDRDDFRVVNTRFILRDDNQTEYVHHFTTSRLGIPVQYTITAVDITGRQGPAGEIVDFFIEDNIPPGVVEHVAAQFVEDVIEVTWPVSPEPDLSGYRVYRSTDLSGEFELLQEDLVDPFFPVYRDRDIEENVRYFYKVTAVDFSGNESAMSAAAMRHVPDRTPPPAPVEFRAEFLKDEGTVHLRWAVGERPRDFRTYIVLRRKISEAGETIFDQLTHDDYRRNEFMDPGAGGLGFEEGVFYEYGVLAADSSRNFSDTTKILLQVPLVTPPEPPGNVMAVNHDGIRVNVSWTQTPSGAVVYYNVARETPDNELTHFRRLPVRERRLRDETVELGMEYRYAVSAVDSAGNESEPVFSDKVQVRNYDPPRQVRNVRIAEIEDGLEISWEPVVSAHLAGYKVYRSGLATGVYEPLTEDPIEDTRVIVEEHPVQMWYRIRAVDISGNESRPSEPVRAGS